jgi:hypothetical protein
MKFRNTWPRHAVASFERDVQVEYSIVKYCVLFLFYAYVLCFMFFLDPRFLLHLK